MKRIPSEIKVQILTRIKEEGVSANKAASDAGISPKTVYGWLEMEGTGISLWEYRRLKNENKELYEIIGRLTKDLNKFKKN